MKALTDALNGIVYADDSQIVQILAVKRYAPRAETIVTVDEL